jgi:uncharacterized protein YndB with AHSA1/START domain
MTTRETYDPGPAGGAHIEKNGEHWTLVLVRQLRHSPELVWQAITDPAHLHEWAPFEAEGSLATEGGRVKLSTVGAPTPMISETLVKRAERPRLLEYDWGGKELRWELLPWAGGTRLTLWHNIDRGYIAMGAAGWHICFDVMERLLDGEPIGRIVAGDAMQLAGFHRLHKEYAAEMGLKASH